MKQALISIRGMSCAACAGSVTDALEAIPHVQKAGVSLLTNEAKVDFSEPGEVRDLVKAIEDCGFEALLESESTSKETPPNSFSTTLDIVGMTCGACSASITEALESAVGVILASVSLITSLAKVIHDASLSAESLVSIIEDCGFDATLASSNFLAYSQVSVHEETKLEVLGMTCGSCSASITEALQKLPGVIDASVSQITSAASVTHESSLKPSIIKDIIEDCGFDARILLTRQLCQLPSPENQKDEFVLQINGIKTETDLSALQYNVEAILNGLAGVENFQFIFKGQVNLEDHEEDTSDLGQENLTDELKISLFSDQTGIRHLLDSLNAMDSQIQFAISNSVDQALSSQLKILAKTKDIHYWRSNFCYSLVAGAPILALSLTENTDFWKSLLIFHGLYLVTLLEFGLATYILFHLGSVFFKKFKVFIRHKGKNANMDVLVCISTSVSYLFSVLSMFLSAWSGQTVKPPKVLFETVAMLVCFVSFGKWIENRAKGSTSSALSKLMSLTPKTCTIIDDEAQLESIAKISQDDMYFVAADISARTIPIDLIQKDDIAVVYAGGKIPADGRIIYGSTDVDESIITGESLPVQKKVGDTVIGGSINGPFLIYIQVTGAGKNSQLHQIINIVKESQVNKAPVQRFADFVAARFVGFVLCLSIATLIFWTTFLKFFPQHLPNIFITHENGKYFVCLNLAISVIVVACPCALGLAAPTAVMVGTGVSATYGALIKGGDVLEKSNAINVILFDKTGTLTQGELQIANFKHNLKDSGLLESQWWTLVWAAETYSEHPTGKAISAYSKEKLSLTSEKDASHASVEDFKVYTGMGVRARIVLSGIFYDVTVGNKQMIVRDFPSARSDLAKILETDLKGSIASISHVIINGSYRGYFELSDTIKPCAKVIIDYLQHVEHYQVGIVTGDNKEVAYRIGSELGVPTGNIFSEVSPIDKDKVVTRLRDQFGGKENISIAFVGDGINDAPALVQADIGMAISTGTDIAIDSAEVVLMGSQGKTNDLFGVVNALQISQASFKKIKWNFFGATIYNFLMLPFAMGCFLKYGWMLSPVSGAGAMACSSISVVLNSLMLKKWKPPRIKEIVENLYLNEETIGNDFSLKTSTLDEFNIVKRGNLKMKMKINNGSKFLSGFRRTVLGQSDYEMVESPQH